MVDAVAAFVSGRHFITISVSNRRRRVADLVVAQRARHCFWNSKKSARSNEEVTIEDPKFTRKTEPKNERLSTVLNFTDYENT